MDAELSPSKRRKTSHADGIQVGASTTRNGHIRQDAVRQPTERRLYMSPTKASLSRFNPNLLPRSGSVEPRQPRSMGVQSASRRARTVEDNILNANAEQYGDPNAHARSSGNMVNGKLHSRDSNAPPNIQDTPSKLPRQEVAHGDVDTLLNHNPNRTPTHADSLAHGGTNGQADEDEPSLPSTPSQLGLEPPPEKPRGLLFHSPSRKRALSSRHTMLSSPLKPRNHTSRSTLPFRDQVAGTLGSRNFIDGAPKQSSTGRRFGVLGRQISLQQIEARLLALQHEITMRSMESPWRKENKKMGKVLMKKRQTIGKHGRELLEIQAGSRGEPPAGLEQLRLKASRVDQPVKSGNIYSRLAQFSPFSERRSLVAPKHSPDLNSEEIQLTFRILSSSLALDFTDGLLVRQDVEVATLDGKKIARLQMSIDLISQTLKNLDTSDVATWAIRELSPWLQKPPNGRTPTLMSSAIGRYVELSRKRAECWSHCSAEMVNLISTDMNSISNFAGLGLCSIQISRSTIAMPIEWQISINDEGDVESSVSCKSSFPKEWRQFDARADLSKVDEIFYSLVIEKGVTEAVRIMTKILFPP